MTTPGLDTPLNHVFTRAASRGIKTPSSRGKDHQETDGATTAQPWRLRQGYLYRKAPSLSSLLSGVLYHQLLHAGAMPSTTCYADPLWGNWDVPHRGTSQSRKTHTGPGCTRKLSERCSCKRLRRTVERQCAQRLLLVVLHAQNQNGDVLARDCTSLRDLHCLVGRKIVGILVEASPACARRL